MKKIFILLYLTLFIIQPSFAGGLGRTFHLGCCNEEKAVKKVLESQVKFANKTNFNKFIATYDDSYVNADGFNLDSYSAVIKDLWNTYDNIKYGIKIKSICVNDDKAEAELLETSYAEIPVNEKLSGELKSKSNSIYYLKKINGSWKVVSDEVIDETTTLLYGEAKNLDIKLTAPAEIPANTEYSAILEFTPPAETFAIASIAADKVEYPQEQTKEVFRAFPEDNMLERLFTSNSNNLNEYVIASIGLTKTDIEDLSIKLSLTGFGYTIKRINVIPQNKLDNPEENLNNDESK